MAGLTAASLLAQAGAELTVFEQNWMAGGCSSTYWRKGYWFETGATTLVGLDEGMPLERLMKQLDMDLPALPLALPMEVRLGKRRIQRHQSLEAWISEAENHFGPAGQRSFWTECYTISRQVWQVSGLHTAFPPQNFGDLISLAGGFRPHQLQLIPEAFRSMESLLQKHGLQQNHDFIRFVDEQLMITAQNTHTQVNVLFGATALCYTNFGNYYLPGGMRNLVDRLTTFIESKNGQIHFREGVVRLLIKKNGISLRTSKAQYPFDAVVSAVPLNNLSDLLEEGPLKNGLTARSMGSEMLSSALQLGIGFRPHRSYDCLHYQLHLAEALPGIGSKSIFLSLHPANDTNRAPEGHMAASVSTHWPNPQGRQLADRTASEQLILQTLEKHDLILQDHIHYLHSSGPKSWEKWTGRKWGFVGGYPQYKHIKPWQMQGARLLKHRLYACGDSTYPGQGIPGAVLSAQCAYKKMQIDGLF